MSSGNLNLEAKLTDALNSKHLLESSAQNIRALLASAPSPLYQRAITELFEASAWNELNDRFYKTLEFGTGGIRGRTIGKIVTRAERGQAGDNSPPEFPCVGTNAVNFYNISRSTQGLVRYLIEWRENQKKLDQASIVIAYDSRHFSKDFADLAARVAAENGCDAHVFEGPRSTPELSFAVRYLHADAGIMITASHNPPHDNGYKVYFGNGAQVIEPHASGIIGRVNAIKRESYEPLPSSEQGRVTSIGDEIDQAYMRRLETLVLDRDLIQRTPSLGIVFTPLHGTGGVIIEPILKKLGFRYQVVAEQDRFDGNFSTVQSPNPENAEALTLAIHLAEKEKADLVIATDPDCDRMGVAVRNRNGGMSLLTGNQIGSLLAFYRTKTLFDQGILTKENAGRGVIIKTFVTTDLQKAIANHYGLRCVETLTGFKYIGAKLGKYEQALPKECLRDYRELTETETRRLRLSLSSFYVYGGEESYGYSGADFVRDKDGNGAAVMFCEVAAYAKSRDLTLDTLLDEISAELGCYLEKNGSFILEGAEGAAKIERLLDSYAAQSPVEMLGLKVDMVRDFSRQNFRDVEGDEIPKEKMFIFELADKTRVAVRGSGTEPKIKYYLFAQRRPKVGKFSVEELDRVKAGMCQHLESLWQWLQEDAKARLA